MSAAKERTVYLNGKMLPESKALISIHDQGFVNGDAVFDVTRTFRHEIFKLTEHIDRLFDSVTYLRIKLELTKADMIELTHKVLDSNIHLLDDNDDYWVMHRVSRGIPTVDGHKPTVVIECRPLPWERAKLYKEGVEIITPSVRRTPPESVSPRAKIQNYVNMILADLEVKSRNPSGWPVLLDYAGNLCEGTNSNIFLVKNGEVFTPRSQMVLGGISRQTVIDLAKKMG